MLNNANVLIHENPYIVNSGHIDSFDNNDVFVGKYEISIGNSYRDAFFEKFFMKNNPAE